MPQQPKGSAGLLVRSEPLKSCVPETVQDLLPRRRLERALDEVRDRPLVIVCAPAGFGKTTLLSEWVRTLSEPVLWVSLDRHDNDPVAFLQQLANGILEDGRPRNDLLRALTLLDRHSLEPLLEEFFDAVRAADRPCRVLLDDYHLIESATVHRAVGYLVEHTPPQLKFVIVTRVQPPLPLSRWRLEDRVAEIPAEELRFTPQEANAYLNSVKGLSLTSQQVESLLLKTEGWVAGFKLATISMALADDQQAFVEEFSGKDSLIIEYLSDEVIRGQDERTREFLLQTSVLGGLCGSLCNAVTGAEDGQRILERLERERLFVVPLDRKRQWYRYHNMFAELLQKRLKDRGPETWGELNRRASVWYEAEGRVHEAIQHAFAGGDWLAAARLTEPVVFENLSVGSIGEVRHWLDQFPNDFVAQNHRLSLAHAWTLLMAGEIERARTRVAEAEALSGGDPELQATVSCVKSWLTHFCGNTPLALAEASSALEDLPPGATIWRALAQLMSAIARSSMGQVREALEHVRLAYRLSLSTDSDMLNVVARAAEGRFLAEQGKLHAGAEMLRKAVQDLSGLRYQDAIVAYSELGAIYRQWNQLDDADRLVAAALELGRKTGRLVLCARVYTELALVQASRGNVEAADQAIVCALDGAQRLGSKESLRRVRAIQARVLLQLGDASGALRWQRELALDPEEEPTFEQEQEYLTSIRYLLAQRQPEKALELMAPLLQKAESEQRMATVIELLALQALGRDRAGDSEQALFSLGRALELAEPEKFLRVFLDEGAPMADLIQRAVQRDIHPEYGSSILAAFASEGLGRQTAVVPLSEPLTHREKEILSLIAAGLTNQEISGKLFIALQTVKTHINNVYRKLEVRRRTEAVSRARELNLLDD